MDAIYDLSFVLTKCLVDYVDVATCIHKVTSSIMCPKYLCSTLSNFDLTRCVSGLDPAAEVARLAPRLHLAGFSMKRGFLILIMCTILAALIDTVQSTIFWSVGAKFPSR